MTTRKPTKAERSAHAARVRADRQVAFSLRRCRDCPVVPAINPRTGLPFRSCDHHRKIDRERKKKPHGKR